MGIPILHQQEYSKISAHQIGDSSCESEAKQSKAKYEVLCAPLSGVIG